jgi:hypothetical protein
MGLHSTLALMPQCHKIKESTLLGLNQHLFPDKREGSACYRHLWPAWYENLRFVRKSANDLLTLSNHTSLHELMVRNNFSTLILTSHVERVRAHINTCHGRE